MTQEHAWLTDVREHLAVWRTASLATVNDAGGPHAANVQFALDDSLRLYWVSSKDAAHSRHLASRPAAAVTVYAHEDRPDRIRGVQMHGTAAPIAPADAGRVSDLYVARFDFIADSPQLIAAVQQQQFYQFTPTWVRWIDNRRGFGWKVETSFDGG